MHTTTVFDVASMRTGRLRRLVAIRKLGVKFQCDTRLTSTWHQIPRFAGREISRVRGLTFRYRFWRRGYQCPSLRLLPLSPGCLNRKQMDAEIGVQRQKAWFLRHGIRHVLARWQKVPHVSSMLANLPQVRFSHTPFRWFFLRNLKS